MAETTTLTVCIDQELKQASEDLFHELGMDLETAINVFLRQAIRTGGFPFDIRLGQPNSETMLALEESEDIASDLKTARTYSSVEEALTELKE